MSGHVFVDESKARDYLLVAAAFVPGDVARATKDLRTLYHRGQPRLHMKKESEPLKRQLLSTITAMPGLEVRIYQAGRTYRTEWERREQCLIRLVHDLAAAGHDRLCLERDESIEDRDRRVLYREAGAAGIRDALSYQHASATVMPLLAVPDAVAWAWAKGGDWRRRCEPVVREVTAV